MLQNNKVTRKCFVLGEGGTAQQIIAKAIPQINKKAGTLDAFACRIIDTDLDSKNASILRPYFIGLNTLRAELIRKNPKEFPEIANILRLEKIPPLTSTQGTGQFLSQGDLMFKATEKEIIDNIRTAITPLISGQLNQRLSEQGITLADERIYVFNIRSIAGGVGSSASGRFLSILKRELMTLLKNRQRYILVDIIVRPEPYEHHVEDRQKIFSNAYASIHTLHEYYNSDLPIHKVKIGDDLDLEVEIGGEQVPDVTFLISNRNLTGSTDALRGSGMLSLEEVYDMVAQFLVLHQYSPMISEFYDKYANSEHESKTKIRGQQALFSGFGILELCFPVQKAKQWLAEELAASVLKHLKGGEQCLKELKSN